MTKLSLYQEYVKIVNIYASNIGENKNIKKKKTKLKKKKKKKKQKKKKSFGL